MSKVSIQLVGPPVEDAQRGTLTVYGPTGSDGLAFTVVTFKNNPPDEMRAYMNRYNRAAKLAYLSGGNPVAYDTILNWRSIADDQHRLEFDPSDEEPQNWLRVRHYWNCDPNWSDPNWATNSVIHCHGERDRLVYPKDLSSTDVEYIAKSSRIVADMGARSLKQLVECVAQIKEISTELLPTVLEETQKTNVTLEELRKRTNGKSCPL